MIYRSKNTPKRISNSVIFRMGIVFAIFFIFILSTSIKVPPFRAFGGAVWLKNGIQYISDEQISSRSEQLNIPKEELIASTIKSSTQSCDNLEEGFCLKSSDEYAYKTLLTPAVAYRPSTPDVKQVIGYCTLCNDGSFSPSCAVGRGACSWHGGVAAYNVPRYRTIPGTPEVSAQPPIYEYSTKSYKDSNLYLKPETPSLNIVTNY